MTGFLIRVSLGVWAGIPGEQERQAAVRQWGEAVGSSHQAVEELEAITDNLQVTPLPRSPPGRGVDPERVSEVTPRETPSCKGSPMNVSVRESAGTFVEWLPGGRLVEAGAADGDAATIGRRSDHSRGVSPVFRLVRRGPCGGVNIDEKGKPCTLATQFVACTTLGRVFRGGVSETRFS